MPEKMLATIPVFVYMLDESNGVYLQRRHQTGYLDGFYEPPAGKVDQGEFPSLAACREALEESGVTIQPDNLELFHTYINLTDNSPWLGLMYRTHVWQGEPLICEPEKCDDAAFFKLDKLPRLTPQVADGLARVVTATTIETSEYDAIR